MKPGTRPNAGGAHDLRPATDSTAAATRCGACQRVHVPARSHRCLGCGSHGLAPTRVELRGVFESWTLPHTVEPDGPAWALGLVTLDAGPMLTVRVKITDTPLSIGARVAGTAERPPAGPERFWFEVLSAPDTVAPRIAEVAA
jgi:uncharacterized OB-fold protein